MELHEAGGSLREIATTLEGEGHTTKRGGRWHPKVIASVIRRESTA